MHRIALTLAALISLLFLAIGCAPKPQNIRINPQVRTEAPQSAASQAAEGVALGLAVVDVRRDDKLGTMDDASGKLVDVKTTEGSAGVIQQRVSDALTAKGFKVEPL